MQTRDGNAGSPAALHPDQALIRLLVVDDHRTIADLLAIALQHECDIEFVGHAGTAHLGILNSPQTWAATYDYLSAPSPRR